MQDFELKSLISKLTGVTLIKQAMPLMGGQLNLKNRKLIWHNFDPKTMPIHLPDKMKSEVSKFYNDYASYYKQFVPEANIANFDSMMFAWYAEDASVTEDDMKRIESSNIPNKARLLQLAKFITDNGIPLGQSRAEFNESAGQHAKQTFNGGDQHLAHFGWAWGAKELPPEDDGRRAARPLTENRVGDMAWLKQHVFDKGEILVTPITAEEDGAYGIFLTEDGSDKLPVIPEAMVREMKQYMAGQDKPLTPDTPIMKHLLKAYGGFEKFFIYKSAHDPSGKGMQWAFTPGEKRFLLDMRQGGDAERPWDLEKDTKDPHPKGIHWKDATSGLRPPKPANDGRHRGMFIQAPQGSAGKYKKNQTIDQRVFVAMIRANGTMYWQQEKDPSTQVNMTEEQVNHFNQYQGKIFRLGNPGFKKWGFGPDQKEEYQQYLNDCHELDQLRNFITETTGKTHVASQKYQVVLVAPRFTFGKQVGETETAGFMYHPATESENAPQEAHGGEFTGKRDEWVIEKTEYDLSAARAAKFKGGMDLPQSVHGGGALSDSQNSDSCEHAIKRAIQLYKIPSSVQPPEAKIQAAQQAFDNAKNFYKGQAEEQPIDNTSEVVPETGVQPPVPTTDPLAGIPVNEPKPQPKAPAPVVQNTNLQPNQESELAKSSKDILNKLKKLG
jgi:hypothetical protein